MSHAIPTPHQRLRASSTRHKFGGPNERVAMNFDDDRLRLKAEIDADNRMQAALAKHHKALAGVHRGPQTEHPRRITPSSTGLHSGDRWVLPYADPLV